MSTVDEIAVPAGNSPSIGAPNTVHDSDFYAWTQQQADALRCGRLDALDVANLIEEIEDMGRSERNALESRLRVLLAHLLKWQYQPRRRCTSWEATIRMQRKDAAKLLSRNQSLEAALAELLED